MLGIRGGRQFGISDVIVEEFGALRWGQVGGIAENAGRGLFNAASFRCMSKSAHTGGRAA